MQLAHPLRRQRWLRLPLAALAFASCGTSALPVASSPVPTTSTSLPPLTEPVVTEARLRTILLRPADLPAGFGAQVAGAGRDNVSRLQVCGQPVAATQGAISTAEAAYSRADHLQVSELLMSFASTADADRAVAQLARLPAHCPVDGQVAIKALSPPAVGESVAGAQLTTGAAVTEVAIVRSGVIDAVVVVTGPPLTTASTWTALVQAVGTALAVGTGG